MDGRESISLVLVVGVGVSNRGPIAPSVGVDRGLSADD